MMMFKSMLMPSIVLSIVFGALLLYDCLAFSVKFVVFGLTGGRRCREMAGLFRHTLEGTRHDGADNSPQDHLYYLYEE